jgi:hypothetical protein
MSDYDKYMGAKIVIRVRSFLFNTLERKRYRLSSM